MTGIVCAVGAEQLTELLDVEFVLGDDAAIGGAGHGGEHGGEAGIAAKNFQYHEAFVRARGRAQIVGELNGARDAGAEANAVIGAGDIVVHGLGNADDLETFLIKTHGIAECVVATDGDEIFDAQPVEILQNFGS